MNAFVNMFFHWPCIFILRVFGKKIMYGQVDTSFDMNHNGGK